MIPIPSGEASLPYTWFGDGPIPLVLIPGLGGKGRSWEPFLSSIQDPFRTLVFDPPGSGQAAALEGPVTIRGLAESTLELLDSLGLPEFAVVGRSMGGMIAQELALLAPGRVSRLVLASTTARVDRHLAEVFHLWARMADLGVPPEVRHRSAMLWCLGAQSLADGGRAMAYLRAKAVVDRPADYAMQARACAEHDALARLPAVQVPTLVVAGTDDRLTPSWHAERLAGTLPNARLLYIEGTGHLPYLEAPGAFQKGVLEFLQEDTRPSTGEEENGSCPNASKLS
jgi:pimeloyl-ACP methyl ester carboxylesterase